MDSLPDPRVAPYEMGREIHERGGFTDHYLRGVGHSPRYAARTWCGELTEVGMVYQSTEPLCLKRSGRCERCEDRIWDQVKARALRLGDPEPERPFVAKYDADYEECMGCTSERCRGAGFLDVRLAGGKTGLICSNCAEAAVDEALDQDHGLTNLRLRELAKRITDRLGEC